MSEYRVSWHIDVDADSPREAAEEAMRLQRKFGTTANVFDVTPHKPGPRGIALTTTIDLDEPA